jgi:cysteine peptidase C11 family protein
LDLTNPAKDHLTNQELRDALLAITEGGSHPIDVLHFDGCLMGLIENAYQARGLANYVVSSENLAWSVFAYDQYRAAIVSTTKARDLATIIVDRYAQEVAGYPFTIAALDMSKIELVVAKTSDFANELKRYAYASEANRTLLADLLDPTNPAPIPAAPLAIPTATRYRVNVPLVVHG